MKRLFPAILLCLPACTLFGGLTEEEEKQVNEYRVRAQQYFNSRDYEKAVDQAERGLALDYYNYDLRDVLGWSWLELASQNKENNVEHTRRALVVFSELIEWRDPEDHNPKTIFGFGKALYNQARLDELEAKLARLQSADTARTPKQKAALLARADEHDRRYKARDRQAHRYFKILAEGDIAGRGNRREAYEYLMVLGYRTKDYASAVKYGNETLKLHQKEREYFEEEMRKTRFPDREAILRKDLQRLRQSETVIRSTLAKYLREQGGEKPTKLAIEHLNKVIEARPNQYEEYYRRGVCYRTLNQPTEARSDFQTFLRLASLPDNNKNVQDAREFLYGKGK